MNNFTETTKQQFSLPFILLLVVLVPITIFLVILINNYLTPSSIMTKQAQSGQSSTQTLQTEASNNMSSLSSQDKDARTKIIALLPNKTETGVLYKSSNISIDYIPEIDIFQVEIDSQNVKGQKVFFKPRVVMNFRGYMK